MSDFSTEARLDVVLNDRSVNDAKRELERSIGDVSIPVSATGARADGGAGIGAAGVAGVEVINELNDTNDILEDILDEVEDGAGGLGGGGGGGGGVIGGGAGGGGILDIVGSYFALKGGAKAAKKGGGLAKRFIRGVGRYGPKALKFGARASPYGLALGGLAYGISQVPDSPPAEQFPQYARSGNGGISFVGDTSLSVPDPFGSEALGQYSDIPIADVFTGQNRDLTSEQERNLAAPGAADNDPLTAAERQRLNGGTIAAGAREANTRAERTAALAGIGATAEERRTIGRTSARGGPTAGASSVTDFNLSPDGIATQTGAGGGGDVTIENNTTVQVEGGGGVDADRVADRAARQARENVKRELRGYLQNEGSGIVSNAQQRRFQEGL